MVPNYRTDQTKGEWDWYYQLAPVVRRRLLRHCKPGGVEPDVCARAAGYQYVDEWAADLVAAITDQTPDGEHGPELVAPADLVGPQEVAAMLGVDVATIRQWVKRGVAPTELCTVSGIRLWNRDDIDQWATNTGRNPTDDAF